MLARQGRVWVSLLPTLANRLFEDAVVAGTAPGLRGARIVGREPAHGEGRFDFLLHHRGREVLAEVKSVGLVHEGRALFPDAPTARGVRHLRALSAHARAGGSSLLAFVVQRTDARAVSPHHALDPDFEGALLEARRAGVRLLGYSARVTPRGAAIVGSLPLDLSAMSGLLGRLTKAAFLRTYWQRKPLLVPRAFPGFVSPLEPRELLDLACEDGVESRLVLERGGLRPWQVIPGPQSARRLRRLPADRWSLLVQGVDRLVPAVAALLQPFRFLPDWRVDDVMVSFAPRRGSVGPHVDSYDVFLLQGLGRRRWEVDPHPHPDPRPGLDLRILRRFRPRSRFVLEPGDMLYLPPGVGHHGVALEDCMTYSIGFRAPTRREVLAALLRPRGEDARYRDPSLRPARHPGEIPAYALRGLRELAKGALAGPDFDTAVGELLTEPQSPVPPRRWIPPGWSGASGPGRPSCASPERASPSCARVRECGSSPRARRSTCPSTWPSPGRSSATP